LQHGAVWNGVIFACGTPIDKTAIRVQAEILAVASLHDFLVHDVLDPVHVVHPTALHRAKGLAARVVRFRLWSRVSLRPRKLLR